jgi:hypothetical protein
MMVVPDIFEIFVPLDKGFLVSVKESKYDYDDEMIP